MTHKIFSSLPKMPDPRQTDIQFPDDWKCDGHNRQDSFNFDIWHSTDIQGEINPGTFCQDPVQYRESPRYLYDFQAQLSRDNLNLSSDVAFTGSGPSRTQTLCHQSQPRNSQTPLAPAKYLPIYGYEKIGDDRSFKENSPPQRKYDQMESLPRNTSKLNERPKSRDYGSFEKRSSFSGKDTLNWRKKDNPIGIFVWGFPFDPKVSDLLEIFSGFGEIRNSNHF